MILLDIVSSSFADGSSSQFFLLACYSTFTALVIPGVSILLIPDNANWIQRIAVVALGHFILLSEVAMVYYDIRMARSTLEISTQKDKGIFRWCNQ